MPEHGVSFVWIAAEQFIRLRIGLISAKLTPFG